MLDDLSIYQLILLIICGYGVIKLGSWFWRSAPLSLLLWCAKMKCFAVVDTEETGQSKKVTHCLLWPEQHECDQRCIK